MINYSLFAERERCKKGSSRDEKIVKYANQKKKMRFDVYKLNIGYIS